MAHRTVRFLIHLVCLVSLLAAWPASFVAGQASRSPEVPDSPLDDGGTAEVGVEWITDWPGTADDRANWYYSANNFNNEMGAAGWVQRFNWGNTNAWERDFKAAGYGGINDYVIDAVDIAMIGTHGSSAYDPRYNIVLSSVYFSSNNDDWNLSPGEAYRAYGNTDLEWLAFDSCSVLRDDSMWYWHETFDGLHLMLGFANTMYVVYPGDGGVWGDQMRQKGWWIFGHGAKTVTQAWFSAVEDQQPSGVRGRVLAEELDSYNDYIWGQGYVSPDYSNNGSYWYWDHVSGTPGPVALQNPAITELPAVQVVPRVVDEAYVMNIGQAFGLTSTLLTSPDGASIYMVGGNDDEKQVRVDTASGGFFYQNLGELWTDPTRSRQLPATAADAAVVVDSFLQQHDNLPGSFFFDYNIPPTVELEGAAEGLQPGAIRATQTITNPTDYAVHYARTIDIGGGQLLSIVGPGSRQNVYVGDNSEVAAFKGGWREVQTTAQMIPVSTEEQAWDAFLANPGIALAKLPRATMYDRTGQPAPTLAYYEQPSTQGQEELIPVWVFVADLYVDTPLNPAQAAGEEPLGLGLVADNTSIYVPAAVDQTSQPQAVILSPLTGTTLLSGQTVDLTGAVSGGTPPYTYEWTSSLDGMLGSGATLTGVVLHPDLRSTNLAPNIITLLVRDANSLESTASVDLNVLPIIYLPIVLR